MKGDNLLNRRYYLGALCMSILFILLLTSCSSKKNNMETEEKLTIYTTVYPLQFLIDKIGDKHVQVQSVYPPGADEHTFEPTQKTMMKIADADFFIYIGLGLEGFVEQSKNVFNNQQVDLLAAGEKLHLEAVQKTVDNERYRNEAEHQHGDIDPHVWLQPIYMKEMAKSITETLSKRMPEKRTLFEENYELIASQLEELDAKFATLIETSKRNEIIVAHAALWLLGKKIRIKTNTYCWYFND